MKRIVLVFILIVAGLTGGIYASLPTDVPPLQDGDLVFQTLLDSRSRTVIVATGSLYAHMGIIKKSGPQTVVIEAIGPVKETDYDQWVKRGLLRRVAIFRDRNLTPKQSEDILTAAKNFYGRPYDIFFSFNNEAIYCSELAYLTYKNAGLSIGKLQKVSDLHADNFLVKKLIERRWRRDPECRGYDFEQCYRHILDQKLITPVSIARDPQLTKIYSNYPF